MRVVWHAGSGTYMDMDECRIVTIPDHIDPEGVEEYLKYWYPTWDG
jgi:hypothetical protein